MTSILQTSNCEGDELVLLLIHNEAAKKKKQKKKNGGRSIEELVAMAKMYAS